MMVYLLLMLKATWRESITFTPRKYDVFNTMSQEAKDRISKGQYDRQFKKWNWGKYLNDDNWHYISNRMEQRKQSGRESSVYLNGALLLPSKVKKEISRHVHPNYKYTSSNTSSVIVFSGEANDKDSIPQSPPNVTVCTPPPVNHTSPIQQPTLLVNSKRERAEEIAIDNSRSKRQHTIMSVKPAIQEMVSYSGASSSSITHRDFGGTRPNNLNNLPYFQFQGFMRMPGMINPLKISMARSDVCSNYRWIQTTYGIKGWSPSKLHDHLSIPESPDYHV